MTAKKPATALPWSRKDGHYHHVRTEDIDYFIHAANAYPKLVEALRTLTDSLAWEERRSGTTYSGADTAHLLLRSLGEAE